MKKLYIGLMSGTSADGIDAALVDFSQPKPLLINHYHQAFSQEQRQAIIALCTPSDNEILQIAKCDTLLGKEYAKIVNNLLEKNNLSAKDIVAIGSHGQTIRHLPELSYTLQIGDPNIIAAETNITTVADFRRRDIALGGQGAPLVPAFHQALFATNHPRVIVNIGGITNITLLRPTHKTIGFDTGPGNLLLDAWTEKHLQKSFDKNGEWAASGTLQTDLLNSLLTHPFFSLPPPKSSGREHFNLTWLEKNISSQLKPQDVQATLVELTATSLINEIKKYINEGEIIVCGGGAHNLFLMKRLKMLASSFSIVTTEKYGIDPNWIEAMAFAWLAYQTIEGRPSNLMEVTGARAQTILGGVYFSANSFG